MVRKGGLAVEQEGRKRTRTLPERLLHYARKHFALKEKAHEVSVFR